jgi:hypothetical protein
MILPFEIESGNFDEKEVDAWELSHCDEYEMGSLWLIAQCEIPSEHYLCQVVQCWPLFLESQNIGSLDSCGPPQWK